MSNMFFQYINEYDKFIPKYGEIASGYVEEKKSKFISYIFSIKNQDEALCYIDKIKQDNKNARHVVYIYSYMLNNIANIKFSDDGEPQGTGTRAIYEFLTKENISNVCIVIVRYFGGILLGAGPLARTYLKSFKEATLLCKKEELYNIVKYNFDINYSDIDRVKNVIDEFVRGKNIISVSSNYNDKVSFEVLIKEAELNEFKAKINNL